MDKHLTVEVYENDDNINMVCLNHVVWVTKVINLFIVTFFTCICLEKM